MKNSSRRTLLKSFAAAGVGALFIPNFIGCAPSQKLRFAMIGVGARGKASWSQVAKDDIVAMCDVDDRMSAEAYKAVPNAKKYKDFRVMYDEMANEIDAVMIATPDHTHFAAAIIAMQLGKHVLVEKPLVHNIWQCRTMKKAAKYYGIVSQMANQGHTTHGIRLAKEWYEAGVLGEVKEVIRWGAPTTFKSNGYFSHPGEYPFPEHEVPKELDWDLWKGPAADRPFNDEYVPRSWRGFYDFGSGGMADWCCHSLDAPFWSLDLGMPHTVDAVIPEREVPDHSMVAQKSTITWQFGARGNKPPVTMKWIEGMGKPELKTSMV
jgi:predicted dehydrogenase